MTPVTVTSPSEFPPHAHIVFAEPDAIIARAAERGLRIKALYEYVAPHTNGGKPWKMYAVEFE